MAISSNVNDDFVIDLSQLWLLLPKQLPGVVSEKWTNGRMGRLEPLIPAIYPIGHAKQKYLDGKQYDAAFLVHSDPDMTYWGAEPYSIVPWREREAGLPAFPGHNYGAVFAVPFKTGNLETMLRCLLMYHAEWYDICWICRTRIDPQPGKGLVGKIYQCEFGHDFWVVSNCQSPRHHRLIKMGERSFHKTKPGNLWNCVCPECGDQLAPTGARPIASNVQEDHPL